MNRTIDPHRNDVGISLRPLRDCTWSNAMHQQQLEARLLAAYRPAPRGVRGAIAARHPLLITLIALALVSSSAVAAYAIWHNRLYSVRIRQQGEIISQPRVLVAPGQTATITVGESDGSRTSVHIQPDGSVTYDTDKRDVSVDYDVHEVPAGPATAPDNSESPPPRQP